MRFNVGDMVVPMSARSMADCEYEVYKIVETKFDGREALFVSIDVDTLRERQVGWTLRFPKQWRTITVLDLMIYRLGGHIER